MAAITNPVLFFFKKVPWWAAWLIGLIPYLELQYFRVKAGHPFWPDSPVIAVGDSVGIPVFMAATAHALRNYEADKQRFFYAKTWLIMVAGGAFGAVFNYVWNERPDFFAEHLGYQIHFVLVPIYAALIFGAIPYLVFRKDYLGSRLIAGGAIVVYLASLVASA